jgi:hypothetical protein
MENQEIMQALDKIAYKHSTPFCYGCYAKAPSGTCKHCMSDDLMRITEDNGPEYGLDWIISDVVSRELTPINVEEAFESSMEGCYEETTKIRWLEYDTISAIKELDPLSWKIARDEWIDFEMSDDRIIEVEGEYFWMDDVESFIKRELKDDES